MMYRRGYQDVLNTDPESVTDAWTGLTLQQAREWLVSSDDGDESPEREYSTDEIVEYMRGVADAVSLHDIQ